jgi:hypothetical protein
MAFEIKQIALRKNKEGAKDAELATSPQSRVNGGRQENIDFCAGTPAFLRHMVSCLSAGPSIIQRHPLEEGQEPIQPETDASVIRPQVRKDNEEKMDEEVFQTKLTIGAPDDKYEREADQIADRVMRMPNESYHGNL